MNRKIQAGSILEIKTDATHHYRTAAKEVNEKDGTIRCSNGAVLTLQPQGFCAGEHWSYSYGTQVFDATITVAA